MPKKSKKPQESPQQEAKINGFTDSAMNHIPYAFKNNTISRDELLRGNYDYKNLTNPVYLGKLTIPEPENLEEDVFNMNQGCGSHCYVFGFPLWTTLYSGYETFWGEPGEKFRNIGCNNEFILIGENGIFIYCQNSLICNRFYRCAQPFDCLYRFTEFDEEEKCWNFEGIENFQKLFSEDINHLDLADPLEFDSSFPCPEEVLNKFSFITYYMERPFFGEPKGFSSSIITKIKESNREIISSKSLGSFHIRLIKEYDYINENDTRDMKIFPVDAQLLTLRSKFRTPEKTVSAIYINDFPGFDFDDAKVRKPVLWIYDSTIDGYCCGNEPDFYRAVFET